MLAQRIESPVPLALDGWHELGVGDGGALTLDLAQVAFVRVGAGDARVGFGA